MENYDSVMALAMTLQAQRQIQIFRAVEQEVQRLTLIDQMASIQMHYDQVMNNINPYVIGMDPFTFNGSMGPYDEVRVQDDDQIIF